MKTPFHNHLILRITTFLIPLSLMSIALQQHPTSTKAGTSKPQEIQEQPIFDCYDGSQTEMTYCSYQEFQYYDSTLNLKYRKLMNLLNDRLKEEKEYDDPFEFDTTNEFKKSIVNAQRSWINLRDKNEEVIGNQYKGGSMAAMAMNMQMTSDTKNRIIFLNNLIKTQDY